VVDVITSDSEVFPVRSVLLRPCIALTAVVQSGRGKYKRQDQDQDQHQEGEQWQGQRLAVAVNVDCCTFDRVLLYLQHEYRSAHAQARGQGQGQGQGKGQGQWAFDPLLAADLLSAAEALGLQGLQDCTRRVLGSFQERVRRSFISLEEVRGKNTAGTRSLAESGRRDSTWLILDGMVLDISRWLEEHPGGSSIIPLHALDCDCTCQFEIFHASRQSFLYLKEFYLGELNPEEAETLREAATERPSESFLRHLSAVTAPWRLRPEDISGPQNTIFKSF